MVLFPVGPNPRWWPEKLTTFRRIPSWINGRDKKKRRKDMEKGVKGKEKACVRYC